MLVANVRNSKIEKNTMTKATKVYIVQFLCFALIFLASRLIIAHFELLSGLWVPIVSGIVAIILSPQFKVFHVEGKDVVYMAWLFSKNGKKIDWL